MKRTLYLDIIKIVACFLVIINHTGNYLFDSIGYSNASALFYTINFAFCKIGVPLFIMVSGVLLLKKDYTFKDVGKKIFRILIPLLVFSILFAIKAGVLDFKNFFQSLLAQPLYTVFWYLYMLIGLYAMTPFLQKMVKNFKDNDYKWFLFTVLIIPSFLKLLSAFGIQVSSLFLLSVISSIIGFYVTGLYLSQIELNKKHRNIAIIVSTISLVAYTLQMYIPYLNTGSISFVLDTYDSLPVICLSLSVFYLFRHYLEEVKVSKITNKIIANISAVTFGIYLIHFPLTHHAYNLGIMQHIFKFNAYFGIILLQIACFIGCGILIYLLRLIPGVKKFL